MESAAAVAATLQALTAPSRLLLLSQIRQAPATVTELTHDEAVFHAEHLRPGAPTPAHEPAGVTAGAREAVVLP